MRLAGSGSACAVSERVDPRVFEKAPDDGLHADVLRQPFDAGTQAADAAHDEIDLHARGARIVERIDDAGSTSALHLHQIAAGMPGLGVRHFLGDVLEQPLLQRQRRHRHALERRPVPHSP